MSLRRLLEVLRESTKIFESAARVCEIFENAAPSVQKLIAAAGHARDGAADIVNFAARALADIVFGMRARSYRKFAKLAARARK